MNDTLNHIDEIEQSENESEIESESQSRYEKEKEDLNERRRSKLITPEQHDMELK